MIIWPSRHCILESIFGWPTSSGKDNSFVRFSWLIDSDHLGPMCGDQSGAFLNSPLLSFKLVGIVGIRATVVYESFNTRRSTGQGRLLATCSLLASCSSLMEN